MIGETNQLKKEIDELTKKNESLQHKFEAQQHKTGEGKNQLQNLKANVINLTKTIQKLTNKKDTVISEKAETKLLLRNFQREKQENHDNFTNQLSKQTAKIKKKRYVHLAAQSGK